MRYQGKITSWKDDQGFGFITPENGQKDCFVHIKSFANLQRRPVGNEIVTYELKTDTNGRAQAGSVAFVGERVPSATLSERSNVSLIFAAAFLLFVVGSAFAGKLPFVVLGLYLVASAVAFVAYALDKSGALAAQKLLRHKSKKQSFQIVFWTTVVLNCGAFGWLFSPTAAGVLHSILDAA